VFIPEPKDANGLTPKMRAALIKAIEADDVPEGLDGLASRRVSARLRIVYNHRLSYDLLKYSHRVAATAARKDANVGTMEEVRKVLLAETIKGA